jgi:DNA-binding MurR/RpiR family transcriptional regulator
MADTLLAVTEVDFGAFRSLSATIALALALAVAVASRREG